MRKSEQEEVFKQKQKRSRRRHRHSHHAIGKPEARTSMMHATLTLDRLVLWCWVLLQASCTAAAAVFELDLDISIADKSNKNHNHYKDLMHDPSRTYVAVYAVEPAAGSAAAGPADATLAYLSTVHADDEGVFHLSLPQGAGDRPADVFQLNFQSLDVFFAVSSQFRVHVAQSAATVQQHLPGLHPSLQSSLPSVLVDDATHAAVLDGALFRISLNHYLQQDAAGLAATVVRSIPFMSTILASRWMTIAFVSVIIVALLPAVLTRLDPDFADRLVEAQQEANQAQH